MDQTFFAEKEWRRRFEEEAGPSMMEFLRRPSMSHGKAQLCIRWLERISRLTHFPVRSFESRFPRSLSPVTVSPGFNGKFSILEKPGQDKSEVQCLNDHSSVTVQSQGVLEIWRGWWTDTGSFASQNFIVPPFHGISRDNIVFARLNEAATNVPHNINVHLIKFCLPTGRQVFLPDRLRLLLPL